MPVPVYPAALLLLALLAMTASHGCAVARNATEGAGAVHFVYSPYKYVPLGLQAESVTLATVIRGRSLPIVVDGRSMLPDGVATLTLAFATGECGAETWEGLDGDRLATALRTLEHASIGYIIATGGAGGVFTCQTDSGMEAFIARYVTTRLIGFDFDIESGQSEAMVDALVDRIKAAQERHPLLRFSFTLPTWAAEDGTGTGLDQDGERVMHAIRKAGLTGYYVNLMVMNYGEAMPRNCVVTGGRCDMGMSSVQAAHNLRAAHGVPFARIELTPMLGVNDLTTNVFTLADAATLAGFVRDQGLAGIHFWSLDRDGACAGDAAVVASTCNGLAGLPPLAFTRAFRDALAR